MNKGTIEILPIEVSDRLGGIDSLDGYPITFRITDDNEVLIDGMDWTSCNNDGMTALPLVDTTDLDEGNYKLWLKITFSPEIPILGPFAFGVS